MSLTPRTLAPLGRGLKMMIGRAIVRLVEEVGGEQLMQVDGLAEETLDGVPRAQDYGFVSRPLPGAGGILLSLGGMRGQSVVIAVGDRRYRLTGLVDGEVAMHDDQGQKVHFKRDEILIETPFKVTVQGGEEVTVTADKVVVISDDINLGAEGGGKVARIGDSVVGGVITSGSNKVKAA